MIDILDEKVQLALCEEAIQGLACLTEIFKNGYLEEDYWDKSPIQAHKDTRLILQTIVTSLNGIAEDIANISRSIDEKEFNSKAEVQAA